MITPLQLDIICVLPLTYCHVDFGYKIVNFIEIQNLFGCYLSHIRVRTKILTFTRSLLCSRRNGINQKAYLMLISSRSKWYKICVLHKKLVFGVIIALIIFELLNEGFWPFKRMKMGQCLTYRKQWMPSVNVLKFKVHKSFWISKYVTIFSDRWIIPDDIPEENAVNQRGPQRKDALGTKLTVNGTSKF